MRRAPVWLGPLGAMAALGLLTALPLFLLVGGSEVADDAPELLSLVRDPFVLWQSFLETKVGQRWGSFPPLLPALFGLFVRPGLRVLPDFWAIRLGILAWSALGLLVTLRLLRAEGASAASRWGAWTFALLPSVWVAIGLIPQEEGYVALYGLALFAAARAGRLGWIPWLVVATALAAKYVLLILVVPLALGSERPLRNLVRWAGTAVVTLAAYVGYHQVRFGLAPIVSHMIEPDGSISVWGLLWNLGAKPPLELLRDGTVLLASAAVLALCVWARRRRVPLAFSAAASLYTTLLLLYLTYPAYVLWAVPLVILCGAQVEPPRRRTFTALLYVWGFAEWGANFFRGVDLALTMDRAAGKEVFAARIQSVLGAGFPYHELNLLCVVLVLVSGTALVVLLLRSGAELSERSLPARSAG